MITNPRLIIQETEERPTRPYCRETVVYLPLGRSVVVPPRAAYGYLHLQLPYVVKDRAVQLLPTNNVHGLMAVGGVSQKGKTLKVVVNNMTDAPISVGSRTALVALVVGEDYEVVFQRTNGRKVELRACSVEGNATTEVAILAQADEKARREGALGNFSSVEEWRREFPGLLGEALRGVNHYKVDDVGALPDVDWSRMQMAAQSQPEINVLRPIVADHITSGLIERIDTIPKVLTPLLTVPKRDGSTRLVMDFRGLNSMCKPEQGLPLDRLRLLSSLEKKLVWTTLDLKKGFLQLKIDPAVRGYFGFYLDGRYYQWKRVPFGWISSMAHFQKALSLTLQRVRDELAAADVMYVYVDDLLIGSSSVASHIRAVRTLFKHLDADGWVVNTKKTHWCVQDVEFLGAALSPSGIRPPGGLLRKLKELKPPTTRQELREFLGVAVELNRFTWRQDTILAPLREWKRAEPEAFRAERFRKVWSQAVQEMDQQWGQLGYWKEGGQLEVVVDASEFGYGAALLCNGTVVLMFSRRNPRPHDHSSVSEIEAVLAALEAFRHVTMGRPVKVYSDNWTVAKLGNWKGSAAQSKIVKRRIDAILDLQPQVEFVAGKQNKLADALSRATCLFPARPEDVRSPLLEGVKVVRVSGQLSDDTKSQIEAIHQRGHYGVHAMEDILRGSNVDGPEARAFARKVVKQCSACQMWQRKGVQEEFGFVQSERAGAVVGLDVLGPMTQNPAATRRHVLVIVDYLSRYMKCKIVGNARAADYVSICSEWEAEIGKLREVVMDSGTPGKSRQFVEWCSNRGIKLRWTPPYHQSSNGLCERAIGSLLGRLRRICTAEGGSWTARLDTAVGAYNDAPNQTTGFAPNLLMWGVDFFGNHLSDEDVAEAQEKAMQSTARVRQLEQRRRQRVRKGQTPFRRGEEVLVYAKLRRTPGKLVEPWTGPGIVEKRIGRTQYQVRLSPSSVLLAHGDDLTRYYRDGERIGVQEIKHQPLPSCIPLAANGPSQRSSQQAEC